MNRIIKLTVLLLLSALVSSSQDEMLGILASQAPDKIEVIIFTTITWTAPEGVTSVTVECIGGGGGAGGSGFVNRAGGGGGAGGQYAKSTISVVPGYNYGVIVGSGGLGVIPGTIGNGGNESSFSYGESKLVIAKGGGAGIRNSSGATGGLGNLSGSEGDVIYYGGDGGSVTATGGGGGGGGAAGRTGNGGNASVNTGGVGTFPGGSGADGRTGSSAVGNEGFEYGGGGGGGTKTGGSGSGANGVVIITY